jgi:hypothetical protein
VAEGWFVGVWWTEQNNGYVVDAWIRGGTIGGWKKNRGLINIDCELLRLLLCRIPLLVVCRRLLLVAG